MKNYLLALVTSSIVIAVAFLQCTSSTPGNSQVTTTNPQGAIQQDSATPMNATTPISVVESIPVVEPMPVAKPKIADNPKPAAKPKPADKPIPVAKPILVTKPIPVDKPKPKDEPTSLTSAGFTLKLLKATIQGSSTLHDWESQITVIEGKGAFQLKDKLLVSIQDAEIKVTVTGIKSKEGKKMDNKTFEAFNSDENPFIIYSFKNALVKINASHLVTIDAVGKLSMAGTSKSVSLSAKGKELPNGDLHLSVSKKIKMTDYNMVPPVMFLGTIKVGDEITVSFDFELTKLNNSN